MKQEKSEKPVRVAIVIDHRFVLALDLLMALAIVAIYLVKH